MVDFERHEAMKSWFSWGVVVAVGPLAIPFLLWPLWWLAGCEPQGQGVHCKNANWYSGIALSINSLPWLAFVSFPAGIACFIVGAFRARSARKNDA